MDEREPRPFRLGGWFWFWLAFGLTCVIAGAAIARYGPALFSADPPTAKAPPH